MASLCRRALYQGSRRTLFLSSIRRKLFDDFPEPLDLATGKEKAELLAMQAGNDDPYHTKARKRGPGTKEEPNMVPSFFDSRIIGCICEEESTHVNWMWIHEGHPRRCECGHWFKLFRVPPLSIEKVK